jgi:hypothetical protein
VPRILSEVGFTSNYVASTSNILVPRILSEVGFTSNYVASTSNILVNLIKSSSSGTSSQWTTSNNNIYYNTLNVGIGTVNPLNKLHLYDDVNNITNLTIQNNYINSSFITTPTIVPLSGSGITTGNITTTTNSIDKFMIFTTGISSFTVPSGNLSCDILMIGGGGAGGWAKGGGGAGSCIIAIGQIFAANANVSVSVGAGDVASTSTTGVGGDSSITINSTIRYLAKGGGRGAYEQTDGIDGGCGGGAGTGKGATRAGGNSINSNVITLPNGITTITGPTNSETTYAVFGNKGGDQLDSTNGQSSDTSCGGGGIGAPGVNKLSGSGTSISTAGGNGLYQATIGGNLYNFRSYFANNTTFGVNDGTEKYYIGGGGGGGGYWSATIASGGLGGGGEGGGNFDQIRGVSAIANTGSGGGGRKGQAGLQGSGGSGIVIIRYRKLTTISSIDFVRGTVGDFNINYKIGNYDGDFKIISSVLGISTDRLVINSSSNMTFNGDINIIGSYKKNNSDVILDTSNYVVYASNILVPRILSEVGFTSNYVVFTSNILVPRILSEVGFTSNYVASTSNILVTRANLNDSNSSNYVARISTDVNSRVWTTAQIPDLATSKITSGTFDILRIPDLAIGKISGLQGAIDSKQATLTSTNTIGVFNTPDDFVVNGAKIELTKNTSNYVVYTSNILVTRANLNDSNSSNYVARISTDVNSRVWTTAQIPDLAIGKISGLQGAIDSKQATLTSTNTIGVFNTPDDFVVNGAKIELTKNTSNYVVYTSNILVTRANLNDSNSSNYVARISTDVNSRVWTTAQIPDLAIGKISGLQGAIDSKQATLTSTNTIGVFNTPDDFVVNGAKIELTKNTSNYVASTSNILVNRILSEDIFGSNYVASTSNILVKRILAEDIFGSNYVASTSNILVSRILAEDIFGSNYVASTSNILVKRILAEDIFGSNYVASTSNILVTRANLNDSNSSNYVARISTDVNSRVWTTAQIPDLAIGKISGLQGAIDSKQATLTSTNTIGVFNTSHFTNNTGTNKIDLTSNSLSKWTNNSVDATKIYYNTGNVGIGTTDPSTYKLNVNGSLNATSFAVGGAAFTSSQWVGTTDIYNITGNVGIGTSTVNERLTIRGTGARLMMLTCATATYASYMGFSNSANDSLAYIGVDGVGLNGLVYGALTLGTWKDQPILFTTGATNTEKMRIASGGNVGIGTNNPLALLDVVYSPPAVANTDMLNIRVDANWGLKVQQSYTVAGNIQYNLIHRYNSTDYNSLTFKGAFVGVGTNSPTNKLHIVHSSTAGNADTAGGIGLYVYNPTNTAGNNSVIINRIGGSTAGKVLYGFDVNAAYGYSIYMLGSSSDLRFNNGWDGGGTDVMRLGNSGNLAIGTSPHATYKLDVNGTINATSVLVGGTAITGSKWTNGSTATNIYYASGNVGIGTSATSDADDNANFAIPTATLFVKGGATTGGTCDVVIRGGVAGQNGGKSRLWLAADASHSSYIQSEHISGGNTQLTFGTANGNALPTERMVINTSGNVGIGTNNPFSMLHLHNNATTQDVRIIISDNTSTASGTRGFHLIKGGDNISYLWNYENTAMIFATNNVERMRIASTGELYVGASGGASTIFLGGGAAGDNDYNMSVIASRVYSGTENTEIIIFKGNDIGTTADADRIRLRAGAIVFDTFSGSSTDRTAESIRMVINGSGNVGIGNTNPLGPLHIADGNQANNDGHIILARCTTVGSTRMTRIGFNSSFQFCIGDVGGGNTLSTWVNSFKMDYTAPANSVYIDSSGNLSVLANVTAYVSDMRLKTKTSDISEPLKIIDKLNGFYYTLNDVAKSFGIKNTRQEIGLSAQEIQKVLPELVHMAPFDKNTDEHGNITSKSGENYLTISYDRLAPVFVEAIKELNQKNISLTKENIELKEKYNKLLEDITLIKQTLNLV